jgi:SAM-dependent methyltransferase
MATRHRGTDHDDLLRLATVHEEQLAAVMRMNLEPRGETVLELVTDPYNAAAVGLLAAGAGDVLILSESQTEIDRGLLGRRIGDMLGAFGYSDSQWREAGAPDSGARGGCLSFGGGRVRFLPDSAANIDLPNDSAGLIVSENVLQGLPEPEAVVAEMARVLEPGGGMYHKIDLRDHYSQFPLQFLCYSDYVWSHVLTSRQLHKGYLNRLRLPEWVDLFEAYELQVETQVVMRDIELIRRLRPHLDDHFLQFSNEELAPLVAKVYCYKV